jgi:hypothetical protein
MPIIKKSMLPKPKIVYDQLDLNKERKKQYQEVEESADMSLEYLTERINYLRQQYNDLPQEILRQTLNLNIRLKKILYNIDDGVTEKVVHGND